MNEPIICFGQQPCGFFPKRFLVAKIKTAKKLQQEHGGTIVFFYHDSDADYRETITIMRDRATNAEVRLNFTQDNKIQKKYSPLYAKRVPADWKEEIIKQLPRFADKPLIDIFTATNQGTVANFCLEMYKKMGLLEGITIVRSADRKFREQAPELATDYFADVEYQGEVVRAQLLNGMLQLHEGGGKYFTLPGQSLEKWQKNPGRDQRFAWMQSVIKCTHYIAGNDEYEYINKDAFPEVAFVRRDQINEQNYAWTEILNLSTNFLEQLTY